MSGFTLSYYLEDLRRVEALSFSQLNTLVAKYPYCQLLRSLLTRKSEEFAINHSFKNQKIAKLGLFNGRIGKLFDIVYRKLKKLEIEPEILEIKEAVLHQIPKIKEPIVSKLAVAQFKVEQEQAEIEKDPPIPIGKRMRKMLSKFNQNPSRVSDNEFLPEEMASFDLSSESPDAQTDSYSSAEYLASNFVRWLKSFNKPSILVEEIPSIERKTRDIVTPIEATPSPKPLKAKSLKKKKKAKKKKKGKKKSGGLLINEEIYSETLAELLADQGHNSKAIKMYQQLSLIFPEKSALFAVKIEKIKRKNE